MKKVLYAIALTLTTLSAFAQQKPNTISVSGLHQYEIEAEYIARMIVSLNNVL